MKGAYNEQRFVHDTNTKEISALIELCYMAGSRKDGLLSTEEMCIFDTVNVTK